MKKTGEGNAPKNLDRALDLLSILSTSANPMNVMEISKALGITRTTAYSMLDSLMSKKLVERDGETGRYSIGYKVLELAECYYHQYPFLYIAEKYIVSLSQKWSLKVNVSVLKDPAICLLLASKDPSFLVPRMVIGHIMPAYATAAGKTLLAALPDADLKEQLGSVRLVQYTNKTLVDQEKLWECLMGVRENGYAVEVDELMIQRSCVAAPIQNRGGAVIGAISFSGGTEVIMQNMPALINDIVSTGKQISTELGYNYITI